MAAFYSNTCRFGGCGLTFATLGELIEHIEDTHIDSDPRFLEKLEIQQPAYLALSYIMRFVTDAARELMKKKKTHSLNNSQRSTTPTGSEFDEDEPFSESEDSDDSWTTQEEFSSELILSMMNTTGGDEKPFACPVPGCKKRYKNVNGIKYHAKNGHRKDTKVRKGYKCRCGKSYKSSQGLRQHAITHHPPVANTVAMTTINSNLLMTNTSTIATTVLPLNVTSSNNVATASVAPGMVVTTTANTPPVTVQ
ncbi:juxtaposed with another zinc finger protein 1-like [Saccoglossus kowalevskii]|uniref:Juxtaposed with another zinc finger protein 1-like n=1 Tax=Saccoglossus kowalevskii TaxID=10224 RepID=A0ABM0GQV2_SACKO|nr:PREDICTED: juxtaposed with another zinc finger protein 1-like [Saccoglossus kowalevskii]